MWMHMHTVKTQVSWGKTFRGGLSYSSSLPVVPSKVQQVHALPFWSGLVFFFFLSGAAWVEGHGDSVMSSHSVMWFWTYPWLSSFPTNSFAQPAKKPLCMHERQEVSWREVCSEFYGGGDKVVMISGVCLHMLSSFQFIPYGSLACQCWLNEMGRVLMNGEHFPFLVPSAESLPSYNSKPATSTHVNATNVNQCWSK